MGLSARSIAVHKQLEKEAWTMPKYVVEREVPGAGSLTRDELKAISEISCSVLSKLGCDIQWIESYVTGDKIYCIYRAPSEALIKQHAVLGGFQANRISVVATVIDPTTAEA
jgi:hypothetical protein